MNTHSNTIENLCVTFTAGHAVRRPSYNKFPGGNKECSPIHPSRRNCPCSKLDVNCGPNHSAVEARTRTNWLYKEKWDCAWPVILHPPRSSLTDACEALSPCPPPAHTPTPSMKSEHTHIIYSSHANNVQAEHQHRLADKREYAGDSVEDQALPVTCMNFGQVP